VIGLVAVCGYFWVTEPIFMTVANWQNIVRTSAVVAILAAGQTIVVLTEGLDFSMGSMAAASGVVFGIALTGGWDWPTAMLASLAVGTAMGLANGLLVGIGKIPFFIVTLGTLSIYETISLLLSYEGETRSLLGVPAFETISELVNGTVWKIPTILLVVAGLYVFLSLVLRYTAFGRSVYAVGSNQDAARLTGINVTFVLISTYLISGLLAGFGAVVLAGRLGATAPQTDPNILFGVLAAVLIGGTTLTGGDGNLLRTAVGVLLFGVIQDGLTLRGVSTFWQGTVTGLILLGAIGVGVFRTSGWTPRRAGERIALRVRRPA
jgi:ribose transport system permease protein